MPSLNLESVYTLPPERKVAAASLEPLPEDWLAQLIQITLDSLESKPSFDLSARINEQVGEQSTYGMKAQILDGLKAIYSAMIDPKISKDNQSVIAFKLVERAENCTPGFHDGVLSLVEGFERPESIDELLYRIRHDIVSKTANQSTDEVHGNNRFFTVAQLSGYGVRALNPNDAYSGHIPDEDIRNKLATAFARDYRPLNILSGMEDQINSELLMSGYTGTGPQDQDAMNKCIDFLTILFKDMPAVIKQRDVLSQQESYNQSVKDFMGASRTKVRGLISGLTNENLIDALINNRFPASLKAKYLDKLDEETKRRIADIQQDYLQFYEEMKPFAKRMNEDRALSISPFQRQLIDSDKWELNWNLIRQTIRYELCIKQYLSLTEPEESALDALLDADAPFQLKYCEDLGLNGSDVVTLLNMQSLSDEKKTGLLDWYIREGKDTPEDKLTSLAPIQEMGKRNSSIRVVLDQNRAAIDNMLTALRQDWLTKLSVPGFQYNTIPVYLSQDKAFMLAAVKENGLALEYASAALRGDRDVVLAAIKQDAHVFSFAAVELKENKPFLLELLKHDPMVMLWAPKVLREDKDLVLEALKNDIGVLLFVGEALNGDRDFMLEALKLDAHAIQYASKALKEDRDFMLEALKLDGNAIQYASKELKEDRGFMLEALKLRASAIFNASKELKEDRDFILEALKLRPSAILNASKELKGDRDFMLEALKLNASVILHALKPLRDDKDFMLEGVKQNEQLLRYVPQEMQNNKTFVLAAVKQNREAINYLPLALLNDKEFMRQAELVAMRQENLKETLKPDEIRAHFKRELSKTGPQHLTEEQLQKIDSHMQVLENEILASTNKIIISEKKENIDALVELKTLSKTMDVFSAIEQIEADDRFIQVKSGTGSRTHQLIDEIKCQCSENELRKK